MNAEMGFDSKMVIISSRDQFSLLISTGKLMPDKLNDATILESCAKKIDA
jgi:hypothetical protein